MGSVHGLGLGLLLLLLLALLLVEHLFQLQHELVLVRSL